ncbi:NAD-dependent epimerase/dehydratase family protein [Paenibacillus sp. J5C2022]|uniref:NAD-dependent epimerase/dehydratase family protein n=1 Tax=Paenibacillus sp. J5C2022 TaxID=2977129 RepID=UPI0021CE998C|nr:NAD-dependent epimerase/dehydratase family protein [Paenibacillus sp. J5C2022]
MKSALVTGATGFVGKRLAGTLQRKGWQVTAFGRNEVAGKELEDAGITFIKGNLAHREIVMEACRDQDVVFHSGALSSPWGAYQQFYDSNVLGTKHIVEGCREGGARRLVHVSTPSIYMNYRDRLNVAEDSPLPRKAANHYAATKRVAEEIVQQAHIEGLPAIIIRPRAIFGPGDTTLLPRLIRANDEGGVPMFRGGRIMMDLTYVDNVVHALLLCADAPESALGAAYNITNQEPVILLEVLERLFRVLDKPLKRRKVPYPLAYGLAGLLEWKARLLGSEKEPLLTRYSVGALGRHQTLDNTRARNALGYMPQVSVEEGIVRYAEWWKQHQNGHQ